MTISGFKTAQKTRNLNKKENNNKERPNYLSRSKNLSGSLDELPKPKFTRSVKGKPY